MALVLPSAAQAARYSGGAGIEGDPYLISTTADWHALIAAQGDWDKHFIMTGDLDFVWEQLVPVAEDANPFEAGYQGTGFTGCFDGAGHTIRRVILDLSAQSCVGVFACVGMGGRIFNLNVEDITVVGYESVGGLVGQCNYGVIANCSSKASVTGGNDVGGLVGGSVLGQIVNCTSTSFVEGAGDVGALLGQNVLGLVMGCQGLGTVSGQAGIGGLVGWDDFGIILNSQSMASVTGTNIVGGLVGGHQGYIGNSYSAGPVKGDQNVGGLVGVSNGTVLASFWDTTTSGQTISDGGTGKTTALMQSSKTYTDAGWDLVGETVNGVCDFWQVPAATKYPVPTLFCDYVPAKMEGEGTVRNPFLVKTAADVATIWRNPAAYYRLAADLDLAGLKWGPAVIPVLVRDFEGQGHLIKNLTLSSNGGFMGFIGSVGKEVTVSDLGLEDVAIAGRVKVSGILYATGDAFVGAVAGFNLGTISACYSLGAVTGGTAVGGLVGFNCETGAVTNGYSRAEVKGHDGVGGLVGWNSGQVLNSYSTGYVSGSQHVGGLVGGLPDTGTGNIYKAAVVGGLWDIETSQTTISHGGMGRATALMRDINTFINQGWDFVDEKTNGMLDVWKMPAWTSYPVLAWQKVSETALTMDGFESGFTALAWRTGGDKPWVIATAEHYSGKNSAQAGAIAQGQSSTLELTGTFGDGQVSFALKVSSEVYFDKLSFAIDGVEQGAWSGQVHWKKASFPIAPGRHTLTWSYSTDASDTAGRNTTWIDEVAVPLL